MLASRSNSLGYSKHKPDCGVNFIFLWVLSIRPTTGNRKHNIGQEVFTEMTLMDTVLWDVLCSLVKSLQHFKGTCHSSHQCRPCSLA